MRQSQPRLSFRVLTSSLLVPAWLRHELYAEPVKRFEPERVVMRIWTDPEPDASASGVDVETLISSTESISGRIYMKKPSPARLELSCTLTPSSVMLIAPSGNPLIAVSRLFMP